MSAPPVVLAVAGTDSGGAAGVAADLATIGHLGGHAACAVTAVTAQDTTGVHAVHPVPTGVVAAQLEAVLDDLPVATVKTGMLGSAGIARLVADRLGHLPLVVDPVLAATSGSSLGDAEVVRAYRECVLPRAAVATPNLDEARVLADRATHRDEPSELAARLADLGCPVVVTGGPEWRPGEAVGTCTDWLCLPGARPEPLEHAAVATSNDHGTGCTFSSAVAAYLAADRPAARAQARGQEPLAPDRLLSACLRAADHVTDRLRTSATWQLGRGRGPVAHTAPHRATPHRPETATTHTEETA